MNHAAPVFGGVRRREGAAAEPTAEAGRAGPGQPLPLTAAVAAPPAQLPPAALLPPSDLLQRRVEQAANLAMAIVQAVVWRRSAATPGQHFRQALMVFIRVCWMCLSYCASHAAWRRYRAPAIVALRAVIVVPPSYRSEKVSRKSVG